MILITGGAGYIGSHTVKELIHHNYDVLVADNLSTGHKEAIHSKAKFVNVDLLDGKNLDMVFINNDISAVIHFAGLISVGDSVNNPQEYYKSNLSGTLNLLEAMLKNKVKNIIFSSSCATYGIPVYMPLDEKHPQNPINPYGQTKFMVEQILKDYHDAYQLNYINLRYFNAAGASLDGSLGESHNPETHLIPLVIRAITDNDFTLQIFGDDYDTPDGTCIRDYIHVEDLAAAHRLALEHINSCSGSYNLGTGTGISVKEIISCAEKISGKKCKFKISPRRTGDAPVLYADNTKIKQVLNWSPQYTDTENIIKTAWNWANNKKF